MLTHCQNEMTLYPDYAPGTTPSLLFVCRTQGEDSAIPRVMHKHDDRLEIMFIARGSGDYLIGDRQYVAKEGDILVFNKGVVHDERPHLSHDSLIYSCGISRLQLTGLPENHLFSRDKSAVFASGVQKESFAALFATLCTQVFDNETHYGAVTHHLLNAIVILCRNLWLSRQEEMAKSEHSTGQLIKDFIDEHYKEPITLDSITQKLRINRFYLIHAFKRFSGYSPRQYIIRRRVGEAQSLLLNTDMGVTSIASMVGYESVNNFHRVFKMVVGIPPSQYKTLWMAGVNVT